MSSPVEQIKARLGIVEVVSSYFKLEKAGRNFKARCPFHQEKTPSFFVSPEREGFHCFGCNRGGDILSFVEEMEGLDFLGALRVLADRAGVVLDSHRTHLHEEKERLLRVLVAAQEFYAEKLRREETVLGYLKKRGVSDKTIADFGLGFAPARGEVHESLVARGFSPHDISAAGLSVAAGGGYRDRFRQRLMFPLADSAGRVVGFSGRWLGKEEEVAKYINSPQTAIYDKSALLYGLHRAKSAIRRAEEAVLVEGPFDLLLSHQAGVENTLAVSGTAFTAKHLTYLSRLARKVVMAFDGDAAGLAASRRATDLCLAAGLEVKIASLPAGADPAELVHDNPETWREAVAGAKHLIDFFLGAITRRGLDRRQLAHAVKQEVYPYILQLSQRIDRAYFIARISELVDLPEEVIMADLNELRSSPAGTKEPPAPALTGPISRQEKIREKLLGFWWWRGEKLAGRILEVLGGSWLEGAEKELTGRKEELVLTAELTHGPIGDQEIVYLIEDLISQWRIEECQGELRLALERLNQFEKINDRRQIDIHLKQCQDVSRRLNLLKQESLATKQRSGLE